MKTTPMTTLTIDDSTTAGGVRLRATGLSPQLTLARSIRLSGRGLHSGGETTVTVHPAGKNCGIVFRNGSQSIGGLAANVVDTSRGTTIGINGTRIRTIEHLMAALRGMGIDNAVVEVSGAETPALDGSALPYVDAIGDAGLVELDAPRRKLELREPVWVRQNGSFILAVPAPHLRVTYVMSYDHPLIGSQTLTYDFTEEDFGRRIAPARTFVLYEEVAKLLDNDLARGGSFDNAIVVWRDRLSSRLRFPDELVRHKVVDLIGDLSLAGGLLHAEIVAVKSGHSLNVEFTKEVSRVLAQSTEE